MKLEIEENHVPKHELRVVSLRSLFFCFAHSSMMWLAYSFCLEQNLLRTALTEFIGKFESLSKVVWIEMCNQLGLSLKLSTLPELHPNCLSKRLKWNSWKFSRRFTSWFLPNKYTVTIVMIFIIKLKKTLSWHCRIFKFALTIFGWEIENEKVTFSS